MDSNKQASSVSVAAVQMVSTCSLQHNLDTAARLVAQAAAAGAQFVALPEYFCVMGQRDTDKVALREKPGSGPIQQFLSELAARHQIWLVGGTLPLESPDPDRIYNTTLVFGPEGRQRARYDKIHLFGFQSGSESYNEANTIRPGENPPQTFMGPCGTIGLSICYDLRFPELYRAMGRASLLIVPSAFTYTTGKAHWEPLLRARAIENQCYVLAPAQGGKHENGRRTWGHSMLVDPWGQIVQCLDTGEGLVTGRVDSVSLAEVRQKLPALRHRVL